MYAVNLWIKCVQIEVCEVIVILRVITQDIVGILLHFHLRLCLYDLVCLVRTETVLRQAVECFYKVSQRLAKH